MKTAGRTDVGRIRHVNEDRTIVLPERNGITVSIVADGMGGHQAGDIASQMAIEAIAEQLEQLSSQMDVKQLEASVRAAIEQANEKIYDVASSKEQYHGMGTTVVVTAASDTALVIGHIGDSRAYKIDAEKLVQLTEDHSLVYELVRSGQITKEEAEHHPRRNVLTRALGTEPNVVVDVHHFDWAEGDMVLMCSDGLSNLVDSETFAAILRSDSDLEAKVNELVEKALEAGGDDNITVVLMVNTKEQSDAQGGGAV